MGSAFSWTMFLCTVFVLLFNYFYMYPRRWKKRKIILGVKNRREFTKEDAAEKIDEIVSTAHKQSVMITVICFVVAVCFFMIKEMVMQTFVWTLFLFVTLFVDMIPYVLGHSALMSLKKELGLRNSEGVNLVDLKVSGNVHALKPAGVIIPNLVGLLPVIWALLTDLGMISIANDRIAGSFFMTINIGMFYLMGIMLTLFAFLMDSMKNEVISADSDVNANYNRARKKIRADLSIAFIWSNVIFTVIMAASFFFWYSQLLILGGMIVYFVMIFAEIFVFIHFDRKIEARYTPETELVADDDAYWIAGMLYYNPKDKRLNVEKRIGVGATVNLAHPAGKIVGVFLIGALLEVILLLLWIALLESTPITLFVKDEKLICHQLRDEYVIPLEEMESIEYGEDITEHSVIRTAGVGMETLLKGKFSVDGVRGCKLFLNPREKEYIRIVTKSDGIYYISGATARDTEQAMKALK